MALKPQNRTIRLTTHVSEDEDKQIRALVLAHPFIDNVSDLLRHAVLGNLQVAPNQALITGAPLVTLPASSAPINPLVTLPASSAPLAPLVTLPASSDPARALLAAKELAARTTLEAKLAAEEAKLAAKQAARAAKLAEQEEASRAKQRGKQLDRAIKLGALPEESFVVQAQKLPGLEQPWPITHAEKEAKFKRDMAELQAASDAKWKEAQEHNQRTDRRNVPDYE